MRSGRKAAWRCACAAGAALAAWQGMARAAEGEGALWELLAPRSYLTAEIGADGEGSQETSLDLDLALAGGRRLQLFAGGSSLASGDARLDADTLRVGLASDPLAPLALAVEYEWWGNRDEIETQTWRLGAAWSGAQWSAGLLGEWRALRLFTQAPFTMLRPYVDFDSDAWELTLGYHGFKGWGVNVTRREIHYSADVTKLATARLAPYVFTATAFGLGSGLLASSSEVEVTRYFDRGSLGLSWDQTESAIDGTRSHSLALTASYPLGGDWTLSGRLGQFEAADGDATRFGSVGLTYTW